MIGIDQIDRAGLERVIKDVASNAGFIQNLNGVAGLTDKLKAQDDALVAAVPAGVLFATARAAAPAGYLLCDGAVVSRTTYAALFAAIGTAYNTGGEAGTDFRLPDLRGRVPVGVDGAAGRLTANDALGNASGAEKHQLTVAELAAHSHTLSGFRVGNYVFHNGGGTVPAFYAPTVQDVSAPGNTGGDQAHNNMQPFQVVNWIIKT